jgi:hypothetical protein
MVAVVPWVRRLAMLVFAATGFCIMANSLYWLGAEPRLAPESRVLDDAPTTHDHARA